MVSDSVRAVKQATRQETIKKYEGTYLSDFDKLLPNGSDRTTYEKRIEQIITMLKGAPSRKYFVSAFPVFITRNALVYDLIHCTSNIAGYRLYKSTAWKTFGDKSSTKNTHGNENLFLANCNLLLQFASKILISKWIVLVLTGEIAEDSQFFRLGYPVICVDCCIGILDGHKPAVSHAVIAVPQSNQLSIIREHAVFPVYLLGCVDRVIVWVDRKPWLYCRNKLYPVKWTQQKVD